MHARAGFTLVETVVALVLFQVGIAALVAVAGISARDVAEAALRSRAVAIAESRAQRQLAGACASPSSGSAAPAAGMRESWRVESAGASRAIVAEVAVTLPRGRSFNVVVRSWTVCAR